MSILMPRDLRTNRTSTAVWLASKRRNSIRDGGVTGLGPELQVNWDMSLGTANWSGVGVTVQAVNDGGEDAVLLTAADGGSDRGEMINSGLEIGKMYKFRLKARRGAQGVQQAVNQFTWCSIAPTPITSASYEVIEFDVIAAAVSGVSRIYAALSGGAAGDEVYVSELSIREIL